MSDNQNTPQTLWQLVVMIAKGMIKSIPRIIIHALVIGILSWAYHTYLLVVINNGYLKEGSPAAVILALKWNGYNNIPAASIFWAVAGWLFSYIVFTRIIGKGPKHFLLDIALTPKWINSSFKQLGRKSVPVLLVIAALGMIISIIIKNNWVTLILAIAVALIITSRDEGLLYITVRLATLDWQRIFRKNKKETGFNDGSFVVVFTGICLSLLLFSILPYRPYSAYLAAALLIGLAILLKVKNKGPVASILIFVYVAANIILFLSRDTFAHDGGMSEYGGTFSGWWNGQGRNEAMKAGIIPASSAAAGAGIGTAVGTGGKYINTEYIKNNLSGKYGTSNPEKLETIIKGNIKTETKKSELYTKVGNIARVGEVGAKATLVVADTLVDGMGNALGPHGRIVRGVYKTTKGIAGTMAEKGISTSSFTSGLVKGGSDAATDFISNPYAKAAVTVGGEVVGGAITDGTKGAVDGLVDGTFKVGIGAITDKIGGDGFGKDVKILNGSSGKVQVLVNSGDSWTGLGREVTSDVANKFIKNKINKQVTQSLVKGGGGLVDEFIVKPAMSEPIKNMY